MTNDQAYTRWADTHTLQKVVFWWRSNGIECEFTLYDRTFNDALAFAKDQGFKEPKWFKPWTWANGVITVG